MEKETQLDSEISIKEKFKALSPKEKYSYIWEYYKIHIIITLLSIVGLASFIHTMMTKKSTYCTITYYNSYIDLVKDYKKQHDEKQKTERENRKKSFSQMLDDSNSVIADELLFTSDNEFFKNMSKNEIIKWANCCMDFVYKDIGYEKWQVLNATIHLDEKTPHLHCVVVPLIKKYDKRSDKEKWTISKKHYMKDKNYLSTLQDKYHERMISNGYDLDRGIKNNDNEQIDIKQYKKITRKLNIELTSKNEKLNKSMLELEQKMESNKETIFDKEYIKVKKDTFDSMNKVIEQTKKVMEI